MASSDMQIASLFSVIVLIGLSGSIVAQDYAISVLNGTIVGDQAYGKSVHLYANRAAEGLVFAGWEGPDANKLRLAKEWHTTFVAAPTDGTSFELRATYDSLQQASFGETTFSGFTESSSSGLISLPRRVFYALPATQNIKGYVFMIHGTNGSAADWSERYEQQAVRKDLVHNGYAVFAIDANEQVVGDQNSDGAIRWLVSGIATDTLSNIDLKNIVALERYVKFNFGTKKIFMYGGSNGANFADVSAAMLDYSGVCHMISNGNAWLYNQSNVELKPAIWIQSRNDQNASSDSLVAKANYQSLVDRGLKTEWFWLDKAPLHNTRFQRSLDRISANLSTRVYDDLLAADYINADGYVTIDRIKTQLDTATFFSNAPFNLSQKAEIMNQLEILNAEHTPHSEYSNQIILFFDSLLPNVSNATEFSSLSETVIFPNPTQKEISVSFMKRGLYSLSLFDAKGKLLRRDEFKGYKQKMDLEGLPLGNYFLRLHDLDNGKTQTFSVIKN